MEENQNTTQGTVGTPTPTPGGAPERNTLMAVLSYISILVLIPYLTTKNDPFVRFHIKQGLVLIALWVILWVIGNIIWSLWFIISILNLGILVLAIIGIINAVQGNEKELPIVGQFSKHFDKI